MLASRLAGFGTTIFTVMTALAEQTGAINLGQGFPDEDGPAAVIDAAVEAIRDRPQPVRAAAGRAGAARRRSPTTSARATASSSIPTARSRSRSARPRRSPSALLGAGASPATRWSMLDPFYDSYRAVAALAGGTARRDPAPPRRSWRVDPEAARRGDHRRTRLLLLNSPHNPTGRVLDRDELELIAAACRRARPDRDHRRGLRAPRLRRRARPARDAAGHGRAHADDLVDRQDVLADRLEDRLGERAGGARRGRCAASSSSCRSPAARRSSTRPPRRCRDERDRRARSPPS